MPAFAKTPQSNRSNIGTVTSVGMGCATVTTNKGGLLRSVVIASPLTSMDLEVGDQVALTWNMAQPYITANLSDPGSTRSGNAGVVYNSRAVGGTRTGHRPVSLTAQADAVLELDATHQILGIDQQNARTFLGGPAAGLPAHPNFRTILESDLPHYYWRITGNENISGSNFLGTTTTTDLTLKVNSVRGWQLQYSGGTPNIIGGYSGNTVAAGVVGATVAGGGAASKVQTISVNYATIGGGLKNTISNAATYGTIAGGYGNELQTSSAYGTICGGGFNWITAGWDSVIVGGNGNLIQGAESFIGGGKSHTIRDSTNSSYNVIVGGFDADINATRYAVIVGGYQNKMSSGNARFGFIGGGANNTTQSRYTVVVGGRQNTMSTGDVAQYSFIGAGRSNTCSAYYAAIPGGYGNLAAAYYATIPGGRYAKADKWAQLAYASGRFAATGDAQTTLAFPIRRSVLHSDADWYELYLDGTDDQLVIASNTLWLFAAEIVGHASGNASAFGYEIKGLIKNDGGTTSMLSSTTTTVYDDDCPAFDARATADDTNDALVIEVQDAGANGATVRWFGTVRTQEVTYPKP